MGVLDVATFEFDRGQVQPRTKRRGWQRTGPSSVGLVSLSVPDEGGLAREKAQFLEAAGLGGYAEDAGGIEFVADKVVLGESHGAWGGIATCAALVRRGARGPGWNGRKHAVVQVHGEGQESFYVALGEPVVAE